MSGETLSSDFIPAVAVGALLAQVESSLRFWGASGCREARCSPDHLKLAERWEDPDCLWMPETAVDIAAAVSRCARCPDISPGRNRLAGYGPAPARLMFVGGWPSFQAVVTGSPLTGPDGELLEKIIAAMKIAPESVYITHIVKCAPPDGQRPVEDAILACRSLLEREIRAVAPEVICALGDLAACTLTAADTSLAEQRGRFHHCRGISVLPTWHPADIILHPEKKREVWEDVQKIMTMLDVA